MCQAAEQLTESCLDSWELSWEDAGYVNAQDFQNSCGTWTWEQEQLIEAAEKRGERTENLAQVCTDRTEQLSADTADCTVIGLWGEDL